MTPLRSSTATLAPLGHPWATSGPPKPLLWATKRGCLWPSKHPLVEGVGVSNQAIDRNGNPHIQPVLSKARMVTLPTKYPDQSGKGTRRACSCMGGLVPVVELPGQGRSWAEDTECTHAVLQESKYTDKSW